MRFGILGPLTAWDDGREVPLGGGRKTAVLALLVVHRGAVVSADRLIDALWGERPPPSAPKVLQGYVSQLRRVLPPETIVTRGSGYVVDAETDAAEFERLLVEARHQEPRDAAKTLREAIELWRGRPLGEFEYEAWAQAEIDRLEELRLGALEERIEADLSLGESDRVVPELRTLVAEQPLRERLRALLMLALYRSGRQAEALEEFADARRRLVAELGIEPGPELQDLQHRILAQDPELGAVARPLARVARRAPWILAAGVALIAGAGVAAGLALTRESGGAPSRSLAPGEGAVVELDAATGSVQRRVPAGRTPSAIVVRDGVAWIVDGDARTVIRLGGRSASADAVSTGATPTDVAAGGGWIWVANGRPLERAQFVGPVATAVARLDPSTGSVRGEIALPRRGNALSNLVENHLAVKDGAVWAVTPDFAVVRIDAASGTVTARSSDIRAAAVAAGPAGVWVLGVDGAVARLDGRTARPVARTRVPASSIGSIAVGDDAAWVTSPADGTLWRIGGGRRPMVGAIDVGRGVSDLVVGRGAVWIANPVAGTVAKVGIESGAVERTVALGGIPRSLTLDGATLWVAVVADPTASRREVAGVHPFPAPTCDRLLAGKSGADLLVVSDLPLQGGVRVTTTQMAEAIAFVLRERGFRAGRFGVAYQSCDDSVARTGLYDDAKCAANARAYAGNDDVVGVIGTFNSPCAIAALPELNRARGGPLAMISPSNSFVGLTRAGPGVDPALPAALYPTGRRNYLRVFPTDDLQGAALALLARDRGRRRVYVLDDGDPGYGGLMATGFETAARRLGLVVVGRASWDPQRVSYADLARRVARSRPAAVFVGGLLDSNAGRVVRDLRTRLGRAVDLLGPDGLTPLTLLREQAGRAALGVYVSLAGAVTERLPPAGSRFVRRFGQTQGGVAVEPSAVYAAQAAEALLDAIARSDGTRSSVVQQLFATRVRNGLLGSFGFDANGDITESPITVMRVAHGGGSNRIQSVEGGVVERVVRPSPTLAAGGAD